MNSFFIICQCLPGDEFPFYWNESLGWIDDFEQATHFNKSILTLSPPPGATSILEIHENGNPLSTIKLPLPSSRGSVKILENFFTFPVDKF